MAFWKQRKSSPRYQDNFSPPEKSAKKQLEITRKQSGDIFPVKVKNKQNPQTKTQNTLSLLILVFFNGDVLLQELEI